MTTSTQDPDREPDSNPPDAAARERDDDDAFDLLTSPLRRVRFGRWFVIAGPIGLAIALVVSLWVSTMHVRHSVLVQVEREWIAGERLGMRVALVATRSGPIEDTVVQATVEQGGATLEESLALWERGEALTRRCEEWMLGAKARLDAARQTGAE